MNYIFHIGVGRTGTTSIQSFLENNQELLDKYKILNGGSNFTKSYYIEEWQKKYYWSVFETDNPVKSLLDAAIRVADFGKDNGYETIIVSNESLCCKPFYYFIKSLNEYKNFDITIVYYVRNYQDWLISAYFQWAIKHKQNVGRIYSFREYIDRYVMSNDIFSGIIEDLNSIQNINLYIRNQSIIKNTLNDFIKNVLKIDIDIVNIDLFSNNSNDKNDILYRLLFNNNFSQPILPDVYDNIVNKINIQETFSSFIDFHKIKTSDFDCIKNLIENDKLKIDKFLPDDNKISTKISNVDVFTGLDFNSNTFYLQILKITFYILSEIEKLKNNKLK